MTDTEEPDTASTDPAAMLGVLREQERRSQRWASRAAVLILLTWALAWAVGFLFLWSAETIGGNPWFRVPVVVSSVVFGAAMVVGIVTSATAGIRSGRGLRGPSRTAGAMYGFAWSISMVGAWLLLNAVARAGLPPEIIGVLAPALFVFVVGVLYLAGGALWRSPAQYALGCVMIATAIGASFAGGPTHYLIYGTVGAAAMLAMAVLLARGILPSETAR